MNLQTTVNLTGQRQLTEAFVNHTDISETSKDLYGRITALYFNYLNEVGLSLDRVTLVDLMGYKQHLLRKGHKATSVGTYLAVVKKLYKWTDSARLYPDIAKGLKLPKGEDDLKRLPLTIQQATDLMEHTRENLRDFALVSLLLRTGIRTIEAVRSNVGDIRSLCGQAVLYIQGKGHDDKDRFVKLLPKTNKAITEYLATRSNLTAESPLFVSISNRAKDQRMTTRSVRSIVKVGMKAIGLNDSKYTAHSLRHTAGTRAVEQSGNTKEAQLLLGHKTDTVTKKYLKTLETEMRLKHSAENILEDLY
jgi:integrase/recombinase XerD